jgi:hypothetical protein
VYAAPMVMLRYWLSGRDETFPFLVMVRSVVLVDHTTGASAGRVG